MQDINVERKEKKEAKQSSSLLINPTIGLCVYEAPAPPDKIEIQQNNLILILLDKVVRQNFELKRELSALRSEFDKEVINLKSQIRDLDSKVSKPSTSKSDMDKVLDKRDHIQQPQGLFGYEKILDQMRKIQPEQFKMVPAKEEPTINTAVPSLEYISKQFTKVVSLSKDKSPATEPVKWNFFVLAPKERIKKDSNFKEFEKTKSPLYL